MKTTNLFTKAAFAVIALMFAVVSAIVFTANAAETRALVGDVNHDGKVSSEDATAILIDYARDLQGDPTLIDVREGDVNEDGRVSSEDSTVVLINYAAELSGDPVAWATLPDISTADSQTKTTTTTTVTTTTVTTTTTDMPFPELDPSIITYDFTGTLDGTKSNIVSYADEATPETVEEIRKILDFSRGWHVLFYQEEMKSTPNCKFLVNMFNKDGESQNVLFYTSADLFLEDPEAVCVGVYNDLSGPYSLASYCNLAVWITADNKLRICSCDTGKDFLNLIEAGVYKIDTVYESGKFINFSK